MIRALILATVLWGVVAGLAWEHFRNRALEAERKVAAYVEAAELRRQQDARQAQLRAEAQSLDHDLATKEGADGPLSDYLRDAAGRLWP